MNWNSRAEGERRHTGERRSWIRRFDDWQKVLQFILKLGAVMGLVAVGVGGTLSLLGWQHTNTNASLAAAVNAVVAHDVVQDATTDSVKGVLSSVLYMNCVSFQESHPNAVPALCDGAIRRAFPR